MSTVHSSQRTLLDRLIAGASEGAVRALDDALPDEEKAQEEVYEERNLLAVAFAKAHLEAGSSEAGWYLDQDTDGWPVVWVDLPQGQVSWHVTPDLRTLLEDTHLPRMEPAGGYDGHSRREKTARLSEYVEVTPVA